MNQDMLSALLILPLLLFNYAQAQEPRYAVANIDGELMRVRDDRQPALFTADFGDCLGQSAINVTRFDAAYYKDNMTIIFHLAGETALKNESIMMNIGVFAYGESRFDLTFNPCDANIESACPVLGGTPIEAEGIIPVNQDDVAKIPALALTIPDFEGQAILRIFSNATRDEIGCFAAQITNGDTFSQPAAVGTILGVVTFLAIIASFATATCGSDIVENRKHYAHSLSVSVIFAVWHHIYYSGALSLNWPSVLVAFWSNYAWAGGMIYSESMQNTINNFIGANKGNTSHVGAAGTGSSNPSLGGGVDIQQIYSRELVSNSSDFHSQVVQRHLVDKTDGFQYYGQPVKPGLPLPGNYSGFAGTLAQQKIPASNAFMTGFLWFLVMLGAVALTVVTLKLLLTGLTRAKLIRKSRMAVFQTSYIAVLRAALHRSVFAGFFMMAFLTMFQFSYLVVAGPVAVACVVFIIVVFGTGSIAGYAFYSHTRNTAKESVHIDETYIKRFGWLVSRYRHSRWWFFAVWLVYEFVRACFLAGAAEHALVQVFGLLSVEIVAFFMMIVIRPFEGQRLNVIVVYLLGISKVTTLGLSATFEPRFGLGRILATVIGIVIIIIQGLLTIAVISSVAVSLATSYMSVMRNRDTIRPRGWNSWRAKYFLKIDIEAQDKCQVPREPTPEPELKQDEQRQFDSPSFKVQQVKRIAKVEDEDIEFMQETYHGLSEGRAGSASPELHQDEFLRPLNGRDRSSTLQSQRSISSLPRAARPLRGSWTPADYAEVQRPNRWRSYSNQMTVLEEGELSTRAAAPLAA